MESNRIVLRDYQERAVKKALEFFRTNRTKDRPIIVAPTGAGKSIYIAHIANELKEAVLVLQPSKELLQQNYDKYKMYGGEASIYSASFGVKEKGQVTFATIGSIKDKPQDFCDIRYVIIDECHLVPPKKNSMYVSFLKQLPYAKVIGLTATPFRLKSYQDPFSEEKFSQINLLTRERPKFFDHFLDITQIGDMYAKGYLAPIKPIEMNWEQGNLKYNTTGAEYSEESVDYEIKRQKVLEKIPSLISQSISKGRKHRLVFVKNVCDAEDLSSRVIGSACVSAETKQKERDRIIKEFKEGKIHTIFNVGVLTLGFDFPALDTIIIARPTMSLALYMQMVGRGIRPHASKENCAVVDMCGNYKRFGDISGLTFAKNDKGLWQLENNGKVLSNTRLDTI